MVSVDAMEPSSLPAVKPATPPAGKPAASAVLLAVTALVLCAKNAAAVPPDEDASGPYAQVSVGRAFASFLPLEANDVDAEHYAVAGSQESLGFGYGWRVADLLIDVGGRFQHLHLQVTGNYSLDYRDDAYRANYDYLAPLATLSMASQLKSRVNARLAALGWGQLVSSRTVKESRSVVTRSHFMVRSRPGSCCT